jgi:hypothetical protein
MPNKHARWNYYLHMLQDRVCWEDILSLSDTDPQPDRAVSASWAYVSQSVSLTGSSVSRGNCHAHTREIVLEHRTNKNRRDFNFDCRWLCGSAYLFLLHSSLTLKFQFQSEFDRENIINILCWAQTGNYCMCYLYAASVCVIVINVVYSPVITGNIIRLYLQQYFCIHRPVGNWKILTQNLSVMWVPKQILTYIPLHRR